MVQLNVRGLLARDASAVAQAVDAGSQDVMVFTETWLRRMPRRRRSAASQPC